MSLTAPSSAIIIPFTPPTTLTTQPKFEAWRETWHRQVLADRQLGHRAKSVAGFLLWYLNRQERACFPSYSTIAQGVGIDRRDARRAVAELLVRNHLQRQSRHRKTNFYQPQVGALRPQGGGMTPPDGGGKTPPLTSDLEPLTRTCSSSALSESAVGNGKIQEEGADRPSGTQKKNGSVAFDGQVVRATAKQLEHWRRDYPAIPDLTAELRHADDYFVDHPSKDGKWFWRTSGWLKRENNARLKERQAADDEDDSF